MNSCLTDPQRVKHGLRYSVVVPVFNEADNIGPFCRRALAELPPGYELLVCYDFDGDTTLPALAALPADEKPAAVRLVRNDLGRGARYAIEAGMRAARAPVVVVMMADLSDDFAKVGEMVRRAKAGADVVCASRYMRGGRQIGGPRLKGFLSRAAGVSLHWLAGLPTHDPTNSFKAYRKDFLTRTPIESTAGFSLSLELTAKAHFHGGRVEEVPATWHDRAAGESRFRLAHWLPHYLRWYFWALYHRSRAALALGLMALLAVVLFLSNVLLPSVVASTGLDDSWSQALGHAFRQQWRAGVDYVFTYGPLGYLMTVTYDPVLYPSRVAWEVLAAALTSGVCLGVLWRLRSWVARAIFGLLFTVFSPTLLAIALEAKFLFLMSAVCLPLVYGPGPGLAASAAALGLLALLALTKVTYAVVGGGLAAALLVRVAVTRGRRPAAALAAWAAACYGLLWVGTGQSLADLPTFWRTGLEIANSYSDGMGRFGPPEEVVVAVAAAGLLVVAAGLRVRPEPSRLGRLAPVAAVAWVLFGTFKAFFVRHEPGRVESYCWVLATLPFLLWPTDEIRGWRRGALQALLSVTIGLGLYGVLLGTMPARNRWLQPVVWASYLPRTADQLVHASQYRSWLELLRRSTSVGAALPRITAAVGDGSVDLLTNRQGVVLLNGWRWTPRPMFQSYGAHSPALQRRNRDFFRSARAPDHVVHYGDPIDGRLPTLDDGPALLEILGRYEPREVENGYLLLSRRRGDVPEVVGAPLRDRPVRFGEVIDLQGLGPGAKAISFAIEYKPRGRLYQLLYKPPPVGIEVTFARGEPKLYRLIPGMIRDPILIDPLPQSQDDWIELATRGLRPNVTGVRLVLSEPGQERHFVEPIGCTVRSLPGVKTVPEPPGHEE